jgi:hypothetical protein
MTMLRSLLAAMLAITLLSGARACLETGRAEPPAAAVERAAVGAAGEPTPTTSSGMLCRGAYTCHGE